MAILKTGSTVNGSEIITDAKLDSLIADQATATSGVSDSTFITPATSGSRVSFSTTSTEGVSYNVSNTPLTAPLKSFGGLFVSKDAYIGGPLRVKNYFVNVLPTTFTFTGTQSGRITFNTINSNILNLEINLMLYIGASNKGIVKYLVYGRTEPALNDIHYVEVAKSIRGDYITFGVPTSATSTSFYIDVATTIGGTSTTYCNLFVSGIHSIATTITTEIL